MSPTAPPAATLSRGLAYFLIFGLFLTLRGYHSRDGDQAYRLPLLLSWQDPTLFTGDPFVRAFDAFNPHRGYLVLLDIASRPFGLSAGMAGLFALTFAATCLGLDRLARAAWPEAGPRVGLIAVLLVLIAQAGNIGTNHLFEAMLLDRLIALALGWMALARAVEDPDRGWRPAGILLGLAALVHPSFGLQLGLLLGSAWVVWALVPAWSGVRARVGVLGLAALALGLAPGLVINLGQGAALFRGLPRAEFRLLSVELQGAQHMLPHLWRTPQWLAWGCYGVLAALALALGRVQGGTAPERSAAPPARIRLAILLAVNLAGLGLAWIAIEGVRDLRATLFQPFRMATVFRGLALVALSGRIRALWQSGTLPERGRSVLLTVGLAGDWTWVVAALVEVACAVMERREGPAPGSGPRGVPGPRVGPVVPGASRHGVRPPAGRLGPHGARGLDRGPPWPNALLEPGAGGLGGRRGVDRSPGRAGGGPRVPARPGVGAGLLARTRFAATPADDVERLAVWCRAHTPASARFIGPPGPKTFRLWSLRSVAFNRAASPYHAEGLADWSARFRDHVGFTGSSTEFVRLYQSDRHGMERRYQTMSDAGRAALAVRQGASHVVAAAPPEGASATRDGPLELLHVEGRYAVYRLKTDGKVVLGESNSATR